MASNPLVPSSNQVDDIWTVFDRVKMLGRGASGEVWLVRDKKSRQMLALKKLDRADPQNLPMFEQECTILKMLQHPNILRFVDCYEVRLFGLLGFQPISSCFISVHFLVQRSDRGGLCYCDSIFVWRRILRSPSEDAALLRKGLLVTCL